jgi:hypothetical protein
MDASELRLVLGSKLRQLFPASEIAGFEQLLMEIEEAEWQRQLSRITLRCI